VRWRGGEKRRETVRKSKSKRVKKRNKKTMIRLVLLRHVLFFSVREGERAKTLLILLTVA